MIENAQNRQFLLCKWPQYHFSMVFIMVYINSCSLLVCQMNIFWDSTHIDVNWHQFNVKMIENAQNRQFLTCKWPQYHFSIVFISISEVCLCVRWIFIEIVHTLTSKDIILTSTLRRKWSKMRKIVNFDCVDGHNSTLNGFYDGLYQYLKSVCVSDEYLLR